MYTKFNYSPSGYFYNHEINRHLSNGNKIFSAHEKEVQKCLSQYITEDGIINGTDLKNIGFPLQRKIYLYHIHIVILIKLKHLLDGCMIVLDWKHLLIRVLGDIVMIC